MAYLILDTLISATTTPVGSNFTAGNANQEPIADPKECGLYIAPQGFGGTAREVFSIVSGNYSILGLPHRERRRT